MAGPLRLIFMVLGFMALLTSPWWVTTPCLDGHSYVQWWYSLYRGGHVVAQTVQARCDNAQDRGYHSDPCPLRSNCLPTTSYHGVVLMK